MYVHSLYFQTHRQTHSFNSRTIVHIQYVVIPRRRSSVMKDSQQLQLYIKRVMFFFIPIASDLQLY